MNDHRSWLHTGINNVFQLCPQSLNKEDDSVISKEATLLIDEKLCKFISI